MYVCVCSSQERRIHTCSCISWRKASRLCARSARVNRNLGIVRTRLVMMGSVGLVNDRQSRGLREEAVVESSAWSPHTVQLTHSLCLSPLSLSPFHSLYLSISLTLCLSLTHQLSRPCPVESLWLRVCCVCCVCVCVLCVCVLCHASRE